MTHHEGRLQQLLREYADNRATKEEILEMLDLLQQDKDNAALEIVVAELAARARSEESFGHVEAERSFGHVDGEEDSPGDADGEIMWRNITELSSRAAPVKRPAPVKKIRGWRRMAAAAAVFILLSVSGYLWLSRRSPTAPAHRGEYISGGLANDAAPGKTRAVLTLANGSRIILDSATNGMLTQQGNTKIQNLNGALTYTKDTRPVSEILYNDLTTHRGEQYPLTLSDGTRIWLNAASEIRYPVAFSGNDRTVEINGEAYVEVAPDAARPFRVRLRDSTVIQVLGTSFNINAYEDEGSIKTTLLQGAVKIMPPASSGKERGVNLALSGPGKGVKLAPGQQAQVSSNGEIKLIDDADVEEAIAWKNGYFQFTNADLPALLRQLSRWYDLDVTYQGALRHYEFTGKITRNINLASLLQALRLSGVVFKIEGIKLIVIS